MNSAGVVTPLWWWWRIQARILGVSSLLLCSPSACSPTLASGWALGAIKPGDWVFRPTHTGRYGLSSCVETQDDRCPAFKQLAPCLLLRLLVCDDVDYCLSLPAFAYDSVVVVYVWWCSLCSLCLVNCTTACHYSTHSAATALASSERGSRVAQAGALASAASKSCSAAAGRTIGYG